MFLWGGILFPGLHVTIEVCEQGSLSFSIPFSGQNRDLNVNQLHESILKKSKIDP